MIIGAGLGGLLCGSILARSGRKVIVLEQGIQPGGALQCFVRDGIRFDTGFHSVGGLESGGALEKIFRPLGLMELPWERAEADEGFPFLRLSSFKAVLELHGASPSVFDATHFTEGEGDLVYALAEWLKRLELPAGVFAANDRMSVAVVHACTTVQDLVQIDKQFRQWVEDIESMVVVPVE